MGRERDGRWEGEEAIERGQGGGREGKGRGRKEGRVGGKERGSKEGSREGKGKWYFESLLRLR